MAKFGYKFGSLPYKRFGSLNAQIRAAAEEFGDQAADVIVDAMFYMGTAVKENTPHLTGRATAHWEVALNGRPGGYDPTKTEPKGQSIDVTAIESFKLGDRIHLYNKAPYVGLLESGWSDQAAPGQMLRAQAARFQEFIHRAAGDHGLR